MTVQRSGRSVTACWVTGAPSNFTDGHTCAVRRLARPTLRLVIILGILVGSEVFVTMRHAGQASASGSDPFAYVTNSTAGTLTPVDLTTGTPGTPVVVGADPTAVAITPNGSTAYVVVTGSGTVTPVALSSTASPGTPIAASPIPLGASPTAIAITPNGQRAYVTNSGSVTVTPIDLATNTPGTPIPVGVSPSAIAVAPNGATAYVADSGSATVTPINLATNTPGPAISVGQKPSAIAITPNGATAYVADNGSNQLTPIVLATGLPGSPITVGNAPDAVAVSPDGSRVYVVNRGTSGSGTVSVISTTTNLVVATVTVGTQPAGVAVTPDGSTVYVTNESDGTVTPISTASNTAGSPISGLSAPIGLAISPDQAPVAHVSANPTSVAPNTAVSFDASASTVTYRTIVSYQWHFGDGQTATSTSPLETHSYGSPGIYITAVVETDSAGTNGVQVFTGQTMSRNGGPQTVGYVAVVVGGAGIPGGTPVLYVADGGSGTVTPVGLVSGSPVLGSTLTVGRAPTFPAIDPTGTVLLVPNQADSTVTPLTMCVSGSGTTQFQAGTPVQSGAQPTSIAISPVPSSQGPSSLGYDVYVTDTGGHELSHYVLTVPTSVTCGAGAALTVPGANATIPVGVSPYGIAITPNGQTAYVSDATAGVVVPVTLATGRPGLPIPVGGALRRIAVTPDGRNAYVVDNSTGAVVPISTANNTAGAPVPVGAGPIDLAISPDGSTVYVTDSGSVAAAGAVTPVPVGSTTAGTPIPFPAGSNPTGITMTPDGSTAWVTTNGNGSPGTGTITPISTATKTAGTAMSGFSGPIGVVVTPDQAPVAHLSMPSSATTGVGVTLDASSSTVAYGTIATYLWFFGDGTSATSATPTIAHTYTTPGTFTALVVEIDSAGTATTPIFTGQTMLRNGGPQAVAYAPVTVSGANIPGGTPMLYITDAYSGQVTPIGLPASGGPLLHSPFSVGRSPLFPAATPDGRVLVVPDQADNALVAVSVCTDGTGNLQFQPTPGVATASLPTSVAIAPNPAIGPSSATYNVYVSDLGANEVQRFVLTAPTANTCGANTQAPTLTLADVIRLGYQPYGLAITPDGNTLYIGDYGSDTVTPFSTSTGLPGAPITVGNNPYRLAITPDGKTVYVANYCGSSTSGASTCSSMGTVSAISTATNSVVATINVGANPLDVTVSPDGNTVYVTDAGSGGLTPISTQTNTAGLAIPLGLPPIGVAVSADNSTAWVTSYTTGSLVSVATGSRTVGTPIKGLYGPIGAVTAPGP